MWNQARLQQPILFLLWMCLGPWGGHVKGYHLTDFYKPDRAFIISYPTPPCLAPQNKHQFIPSCHTYFMSRMRKYTKNEINY